MRTREASYSGGSGRERSGRVRGENTRGWRGLGEGERWPGKQSRTTLVQGNMKIRAFVTYSE